LWSLEQFMEKTMYDQNNIFARILREEIPCNKVYEDDYSFAFHDIEPAAPVHVLVLPKCEFISFDDFSKNAPSDFMHGFFASIQKISQQLGVDKTGYRLITNHGEDAAQSVLHFHVHILAGCALGQLLSDETK